DVERCDAQSTPPTGGSSSQRRWADVAIDDRAGDVVAEVKRLTGGGAPAARVAAPGGALRAAGRIGCGPAAVPGGVPSGGCPPPGALPRGVLINERSGGHALFATNEGTEQRQLVCASLGRRRGGRRRCGRLWG